jgi:sulfatase maturation enzyme AslB (radical SAM superfamily)
MIKVLIIDRCCPGSCPKYRIAETAETKSMVAFCEEEQRIIKLSSGYGGFPVFCPLKSIKEETALWEECEKQRG